MKIDIEKYIRDTGTEIAESILKKYGVIPAINHKSILKSFLNGLSGGAITRLQVQSEIYERSLHEATAFFIGNTKSKFDNKIIKSIEFHLEARLRNEKDIKKLTQEEKLANAITIVVTDTLIEKDMAL